MVHPELTEVVVDWVFTSEGIGSGLVARKKRNSKIEHVPKIKLICKLSNENSPRVLFSLLQNGKIIAMVRGANAPLLTKKTIELVEEARQIAAGQKERIEVHTKQIFK